MGNENGLIESMASQGTNKVADFDGGYFSFAFGDEIALVLDGQFYILNCDQKLWDEVNSFLDKHTEVSDIKNFWNEKAKDYEQSDWSSDFEHLIEEN